MTKTVLIAEKFQNGARLSGYVAELGSVLLGQQLGFNADHFENHAAYIGSWLKILRNETQFLFTAAAHAQRAVDYLVAASEAGAKVGEVVDAAA